MSESLELIVGLGNPGAAYAQTRHNAGYWLVDELARRAGVTLRANGRFFGDVAEASIAGARVRLLEPSTFMNRSGQSVAALVRFYRIPVERILVVHDEVDLPVGTIRLKDGGGPGGHNGLRDVIAHLGENGFVRLRIGVGHPGRREEVSGHVLHRASRPEEAAIRESIERALELTDELVRGNRSKVMNVLNRRAKESEPEASESAGRSENGAESERGI